MSAIIRRLLSIAHGSVDDRGSFSIREFHVPDPSHTRAAVSRSSCEKMRDLALEVGITERAVQGIVSNLEAAGNVERIRKGRRNSYQSAEGLRCTCGIPSHNTKQSRN